MVECVVKNPGGPRTLPICGGMCKKFNFLPFFHDIQCVRCEAVDIPIRVAVRIADGDGESSVDCPDHSDALVCRPACDVERLALTAIGRLVLRSIGRLA